jgi:putative ABC transport system permease protein
MWFTLGRSAETRAQRFNHWLNVVARLRDGVTVDAGRVAMSGVMRNLATQYPETNAGRGIVMMPLRDAIVGPVQPVLASLLGAVAIVLIIACANVASLVLARSIERGHEIAVRSALGASRTRLVRQLVTENMLLALAGGVLGACVAALGIRVLVARLPSGVLGQASLQDVRVNVTMVAYTLAIAAAAGICLGLVPALSVSRPSSIESLRGGNRAGSGASRQRLRDALVAIEIACTLVLVVAASLMARSLTRLLDVQPGFVADHVVTGRVALAGPTYENGEAQTRFFETLLGRVRALPEVQAAGAVSNPPLNGGGTNTFRVEGEPEPASSDRPEATMRAVAGDYFKAMTIRLIAGRTFTARDDSAAAPVIVINESLARRLFGARDPLGARFRFYAFPESAWTVAGVVADVRTASLDAPVPPTVYYSHLQGAANRMTVVIKTTEGESALINAVTRIVASLDPTLPVYAARTMQEHIRTSPAVSARRYPLVLIGAFAIAGVLLAVIGVYGVIAYAVTQRTRELAVRVALGATQGDVLRLVVGRGIVLTALGLAIGVPIALFLNRSLETLLYDVTAADPLTYVIAAAALSVIALAASLIPARRATRIDPALALRAE